MKGGKMINGLKRGGAVFRRVEDGYLISDLDFVTMLLACVEGVECYQAIPNPDNTSQFLFYLKGDPEKLASIVASFYNPIKAKELINKALKDGAVSPSAVERMNFARKMSQIRSNLKGLLTKARSSPDA